MRTKLNKWKLPKKDRKAWLDALESGNYKQAKDCLYINGGYCCLGVFGKIKGISNRSMRNLATPDILGPINSRKFPECIREGTSFRKVLIRLNDTGYSFKYIAKYIKRKTVGV